MFLDLFHNVEAHSSDIFCDSVIIITYLLQLFSLALNPRKKILLAIFVHLQHIGTTQEVVARCQCCQAWNRQEPSDTRMFQPSVLCQSRKASLSSLVFLQPSTKSINMGTLDYWNQIIIMDICLEQVMNPENFCLKQIAVPRFFNIYPPVGSKPNCKLLHHRQLCQTVGQKGKRIR